MKYLLLFLPLVAAGCTGSYDRGYAGSYPGGYREYASDYGYYEGQYGRPYYGGENCGTPHEPKACPPMPRRPLSYYPGDRW